MARGRLFAFSLYNLIPSCQVCNSKIKGSGIKYDDLTLDELERLFPSSENYDFDGHLKFRLFPKVCTEEYSYPYFKYSDYKENFKIEFDRDTSYNIAALYEQKEANSFYIKQRYWHHNREFLTHIDKHIKYPKSFFYLIEKSTHKKASDLYDAVFNSNLRKEERMIFQKIYKDIDELFEE